MNFEPSADIVTLHDEHHQPIEIWDVNPAEVWWAFQLLNENDKEWYGPFKTRDAAIQDAEDFCQS